METGWCFFYVEIRDFIESERDIMYAPGVSW